jgi:ribonuclease P/MRP protein subunit POP5
VAENSMKGKPLLPTLRTKKRYVVYEVMSDKDILMTKATESIVSSYKECFGIFGLSKAGIKDMKIYNSKLKRGILKINHKYVNDLRAALAMIKQIDNEKASIHTAGISGILKKTKSRYMSL